jgi:hypothetical protein
MEKMVGHLSITAEQENQEEECEARVLDPTSLTEGNARMIPFFSSVDLLTQHHMIVAVTNKFYQKVEENNDDD